MFSYIRLMQMINTYGLLVLAWVLFGILHSLMASKVIKEGLPLSKLNYRRLYNFLSTLFFLFLILYGAVIPSEYLLSAGKASQAVGLILATFGYLLLKLVFKEISFSSFIGYKEEDSDDLITSGIYKRVRHPIYTATVLLFAGFFFFNPTITHLVHFIAATFYIIIGAYFEEKKLIQNFGEAYLSYRKNTPFIIPKIRLK